MVDSTQTIPNGERNFHDMSIDNNPVPFGNGQLYSTWGALGFRPSAKATYTENDALSGDSYITNNYSVSGIYGRGVSLSAYRMYVENSDSGTIQLGISGEYNTASGFQAFAGGRFDYNRDGVSPYGSVMISTDPDKTAIEVGACKEIIPDTNLCGGVQYNQSGSNFVFGLGKSF